MNRPTAGSRVAKLGFLTLWLLFLLVPLAFSNSVHENFRLPKLLLSECFALASLVFLIWRLGAVERVDFRGFFRQPVVTAVLPLLLVATSTLFTSEHPLHVRDALVSLWIGVGCLVAWSFLLSVREHFELLRALMVPAAVLALMAILQFHEIYSPFEFERRVAARIGLTSLAGSAFDLAAYLVLPCLIVQVCWLKELEKRWRWAWAVTGALSIYALVASQTLTALTAFGAGTLVLWSLQLPRRRFLKVAAGVALASLVVALAVAPLRQRLDRKIDSLRSGDVNRVLTGRLDGWRTAWWMFREHPLTGVGHGAYRAEFGGAKGALKQNGVKFYRSQHQAYFTNAHSDVLEALAEWGLLGAAALLWGLYVLARTVRLHSATGSRTDTALMWAGLTTLAILAVTNFPLRIALVAYPALLFLSWIFASARATDRTLEAEAEA